MRLPWWKKLVFALLTVAIFFAVLEALLALCGVRPLLVQRDPFVGFAASVPLYVETSGEDERPLLATAENKLGLFNAQSFPRKKPAGAFRMFCLGGSTTYGRPYDDTTSFAGFLREFLPVADSSRSWEVINAGGISYASYRVAALMEELAHYEPDLFIIYTGHNEFLEERTYGELKRQPAALRESSAWLSRTRTYSWIHGLVHGRPRELDGRFELPAEVDAILDYTVGPSSYHRDDVLRRRVLQHLEVSLGRMVGIARSAGAEVLFVSPASNLKDCSPFKSESGDERDAKSHYRRGRVLFALRRFEEARSALQRAIDEDICPLRAVSEIPRVIGKIASERNVPLLDAAALIEEACLREHGHRVPGREYFYDHVHPTIAAHRLLGRAMVEELMRQGVVKRASSWNENKIAAAAARVESRVDEQANAIALRNLAKVLAWAGKLQEAGPLAVQAADKLSDDLDSQYLAAKYLKQQGRRDASLKYYARGVKLRRLDAAMHLRMAAAAAKQGEPGEAGVHFAEAVRLNPTDAEARNGWGMLLAKQGELQAAVQQFRKALDIQPDHSQAGQNLQRALRRLAPSQN